MTPRHVPRSLRERLRAMTGRSRPALSTRRCHWCTHDEAAHADPLHDGLCPTPDHAYEPARSRSAEGSFDRTHRVVELAPPSRKWFEEQGITSAEKELKQPRKWFW